MSNYALENLDSILTATQVLEPGKYSSPSNICTTQVEISLDKCWSKKRLEVGSGTNEISFQDT